MKVESVFPKIQRVIKNACPGGKVRKTANQYCKTFECIDKLTGASASVVAKENGSWGLFLKNNPCYNDSAIGEFVHNGVTYQFTSVPTKQTAAKNTLKTLVSLIKDHFITKL